MKNSRFLKTAFIGIVLLMWGMFIVETTHLLNGSVEVAHIAQIFLGSIINYHLNSKFTWPDRKRGFGGSALLFGAGKFILAGYQFFLFPVSVMGFYLVVIVTGLLDFSWGIWTFSHMQELSTSLFATGITMILGYLYNHWIAFPESKRKLLTWKVWQLCGIREIGI